MEWLNERILHKWQYNRLKYIPCPQKEIQPEHNHNLLHWNVHLSVLDKSYYKKKVCASNNVKIILESIFDIDAGY